MERALVILAPTFFVVFLFNQALYDFCFKAHCLSAAFPAVGIMLVVISAFIYFVTKDDKRG